MAPLPVQLLSAEDQALIHDTMARYNRSIDNGDKEEYLSIFAKDAVKESPAVWGTLRGHDELSKSFDEYFNSPVFTSYRGGQHRVTSTIFEDVKPGRVETWSYFIFVIPAPEGPRIAALGTYRDVFVKDGSRWLIARRHIGIVANLVSPK